MHKVVYANSGVTVEDVADGQTLLSVSIRRRIPHHHQCGGQARCTTCRVQVLNGASHLPALNPFEHTSLVRSLNRPSEIEGGLRELGKRHVTDHQIARVDYDEVARALLKTLEESLGDEFTPEIRQAWILVYGRVAAIMTDAGDELMIGS